MVGDCRGLALDVRREAGLKVVLDEDAEELGPGLVGASEAAGDLADEGLLPAAPFPELDHDLVAGLGNGPDVGPGGVGDRDLVDKARVVRGHEVVASLAPQVADDCRPAALDDLVDAADPLARALSRDTAVDAHDNGVARQGDAGVVWRDLDRGFVAVSAYDHEGGTACPELDYAFD